MKWSNIKGHFYTITKHKLIVMKECFSVGLYRQGLLHDLSKYSPEEFIPGVRYYQGTRSPNAVEKEVRGYSVAWLHHKGRNKHHFEYWIDFAPDKSRGLIGNPMPLRYLLEMVLDRLAASKVYQGEAYTDASALRYFERSKNVVVMDPGTKHQLEVLLQINAEKGEEYMKAFMRALLRREKMRKGRGLWRLFGRRQGL